MTGPASKARAAAGSGRRAEQSPAFGVLVMVGLIAYGVVHLLIAWIAVQVAWGGSGEEASQTGALQEMAETPVGVPLLWITALGLFALAVWMVASAIWGYADDNGATKVGKRLGAAAKAVIYAALGVSAIGTATGSGGGSGDQGQQTMTAKLLGLPFGPVLVIIVGVVIVVIGGRLVYRGVKAKFLDDLQDHPGKAAEMFGRVGYVAKGIALGVVGILFAVAGFTYDPEKAGGLDDALKTLRDQPFGAVLLTLVALGIASFGVYCFYWSRHAKR
ncbi:DUF1206 domain-containing protein [Nakamurella sp. YIM 132087]|uniref:DUF1206 domain-containing protein n=1 Tax=Nakamurella alba TaxID=2665158 RepID=A0A7K1FJG1_9ACTN|nr:DUF1206 domain-containing protein [Nakamurella alba]MTD13393.1 DUF1206 domain-containing protein [Nakamurella alba]